MTDYRVAVLTIINDKLENNVMNETSLKIVNEIDMKGLKMVSYNSIPLKRSAIYDRIIEICDDGIADLILLTVDRKAGKKYIVDEVTESLIDRSNLLISERLRQYVILSTSGKSTLSSISGTRKDTLIINVPENVKGFLGDILELAIKELSK